jgi:uncharacterized protein YjbJ (UPF0337 family)
LIQINDDCRCAPRYSNAQGGNTIAHLAPSGLCLEEDIMDKDRVVGSAKQIKGAVKEVVGKAVGDTKLESEGKANKIEGKVQNVIGGLKDALKGK